MTLTTALVTRGHTQALKDGSIAPRTCALEFEEVPAIIHAFRRMVRGLEFDVSEMALTTYITAREHGKKMTALPIFLVRAFHHGAILHHVGSGIRTPKDLEGKRVGVNRGYTVTTGVWARSVLANEHGVDLGKITWVLSGDEHVAEFKPPANVAPMEKGRKMADLLAAGELDAAIGVDVDHADVKPLIANPKQAGLEALRTRGHYPINHCIVVRDELLAQRPGLAKDVFDAFSQAKRVYVSLLREGKLPKTTPADELHKRVMEITGGDPLPYGIAPNRQALEELIQAARDQGIIRRSPRLEELFASETAALVG